MKTEDDWSDSVKLILRTEMIRRGFNYERLAERLAEMGVKETAVNLRNKVARGGFSATFFVRCLKAMGVKELRLD